MEIVLFGIAMSAGLAYGLVRFLGMILGHVADRSDEVEKKERAAREAAGRGSEPPGFVESVARVVNGFLRFIFWLLVTALVLAALFAAATVYYVMTH
jgi:hypothetical protein